MSIALEEARLAFERGEVPVGAVIVDQAGVVLAQDGNRTKERADPCAHAEVLVIQAAARALAQERLLGCDLYVTLEPCAMCAGAIAAARLRRVYFGASDPKSGGVHHGAKVFDHPQAHHCPEIISGLCDTQSTALLKAFFATRRG